MLCLDYLMSSFKGLLPRLFSTTALVATGCTINLPTSTVKPEDRLISLIKSNLRSEYMPPATGTYEVTLFVRGGDICQYFYSRKEAAINVR